MRRGAETQLRSIVQPYSPTHLPSSSPRLQNYTLLSKPTEIEGGRKAISCHMLPYPYAVYLCHSPPGQTRKFKLQLQGEDGARLTALSTCHYNTSMLSPDILTFKYLGARPGVCGCYVINPTGFMWIAGLH